MDENTIYIEFTALQLLLSKMKNGEYIGLLDYDDPAMWHFIYKMNIEALDLSNPVYIIGLFAIDSLCRACHDEFTLIAGLNARNLMRNRMVQIDRDDFMNLLEE